MGDMGIESGISSVGRFDKWVRLQNKKDSLKCAFFHLFDFVASE
jgi:hypothetical protein